jgi:steroid delta-isomerase-like uncharacterized protein
MPDNSQVARRILEDILGQGKLDLIEQIFDPAFKGHDTLIDEFGRDGIKRNVQMYRGAFPDLSFKIDEVTAAGDKVLVRWTGRGTHRGQFLGKAPTGKQATAQGISVYTFRNGKVVEEWTQWDALAVLQALGITPQLSEQAFQPSP